MNCVFKNGNHFLDRRERGRSMSGKDFPHPMYNHVEKYHVLRKWLRDLLELEYRGEREEWGNRRQSCMHVTWRTT